MCFGVKLAGILLHLPRGKQYASQIERGMALTEIGGNIPFPAIGELPYLITLGPHGFYWFRLEQTTWL